MYSYKLIKQVYAMNKNDKKLSDILKLWSKRSECFAKTQEDIEKETRVEKEDLLDVPNDPMIKMF